MTLSLSAFPSLQDLNSMTHCHHALRRVRCNHREESRVHFGRTWRFCQFLSHDAVLMIHLRIASYPLPISLCCLLAAYCFKIDTHEIPWVGIYVLGKLILFLLDQSSSSSSIIVLISLFLFPTDWSINGRMACACFFLKSELVGCCDLEQWWGQFFVCRRHWHLILIRHVEVIPILPPTVDSPSSKQMWMHLNLTRAWYVLALFSQLWQLLIGWQAKPLVTTSTTLFIQRSSHPVFR